MSLAAEVVGVAGFLTNVWANLLIARKSDTGWVIRLIANVLWLAYGLWTVSLANVLSSVVFGGINVYGLRQWRRQSPSSGCLDHYLISCVYCSSEVRQCRCISPVKKSSSYNGVCSSCLLQLPNSPKNLWRAGVRRAP